MVNSWFMSLNDVVHELCHKHRPGKIFCYTAMEISFSGICAHDVASGNLMLDYQLPAVQKRPALDKEHCPELPEIVSSMLLREGLESGSLPSFFSGSYVAESPARGRQSSVLQRLVTFRPLVCPC